MRPSLHRWLLLLTALPISLLAQQPGPSTASTSLNLSIWNDGYNLRDTIDNNPSATGRTFYLFNKDQVERIEAPFAHFGQAVHYQGPNTVLLYATRPQPDKPLPKPICQLSLSSSMKDVSVMLFPNEEDENHGFRALVMDNEASNFGKRSIRLQSFYPTTLHVRLGDQYREIEPYASEVVQLDNFNGRGLRIQVVVEEEDRARPLVQRFLRLRGDERLAIFIVPNAHKTGSAELRVTPVALATQASPTYENE